MSTYAVTVLGVDRPGIVAETTALLAGLGLNLEDSTMTLLRGRFAMTLICAGDAGPEAVDRALDPLRADGTLSVAVGEMADEPAASEPGSAWVLTGHGGDRPGIVSGLTAPVAALGGTITDLTTRLAGELYLLVAEVELPAGVDADRLRQVVTEAAAALGVTATVRAAEPDEL